MATREIEHTADIGIEVEASDLPTLFSSGGEALYGLLVDINGVRPKEEVVVSVTGEGWEELFHAWLRELLAQFNLSGFVGRQCEIKSIREGGVEGLVRGERLDLKRHRFYTEIKGVTYHDFRVWKENDHWWARVIFDV